jgi:DNA-binding response OmpR family regulator
VIPPRVAFLPMARVLVVDDDFRIRSALGHGLRAEGFDVVVAADGPTALSAALPGTFDAILLDIIIPGLSGYRVLKKLRDEGVSTPILLISAKDGEVDQADGLDLGADGYLVKPFSFVVMVAQLRSLLRRREAARTRPGPCQVGDLVLEPLTKEVTYAGHSIELSPREFAVLHALASRPDVPLSRAELLELVWGAPCAAAPNVVEVYVGYIRRKLRAAGADHVLRTVYGRGYQVPAAVNSAAP